MDEILIGEKKYISSKRAAKVTGYAKDYVGQLCREGRVPARLVGRSWYVLESAIHDHRFGDQTTSIKLENVAPVEKSPERVVESARESPHYEATDVEVLPPLESHNTSKIYEPEISPDRLQDTWKAWFERVGETKDDSATAEIEEIQVMPEVEETLKEEMIQQEQEVNVPIHGIYQQPPQELLPRRYQEIDLPSEQEEHVEEKSNDGRAKIRTIQIAGAVIALLIATTAIIGTGYFDSYVLSSGELGLLAGVAVVNK